MGEAVNEFFKRSPLNPNAILSHARDDRCAMVSIVFALFMVVTVQIILLEKPVASFTCTSQIL